ncbi:MAG: hypothetical protein ACREK3_02035 [Gemmatimonadota bacterium]
MHFLRHAYDATAEASVGQPRRRAPVQPAAALLAAAFMAALLMTGCGDPVGDQRGGFEHDPAPVLGRWVERVPTASSPQEAFIEAGVGFLTGHFEFERMESVFDVHFMDGDWDGSRITFETGDVLGAGVEPIPWNALLVAATDSLPTRLRLFPEFDGGVPFSVEYVRP